MLRVVGAAIVRNGCCLVAQRGDTGKWEFVGGKVEPGETPRQALVREIDEELGVAITVGDHAGCGHAEGVMLDVYFATLVAGEPVAREHRALRWSSADQLDQLDWAAPDIPVLPAVAARLRRP